MVAPETAPGSSGARRRIKTPRDLAEVIRSARTGQKMNQQGLSEITGVSQANISRIERGKPASIETYLRLLGELGFDLEAVAR